jgi:hypothetical protein
MRLVSVGHESARFEDVTLRFTNRAGDPTNSVIWLRNGGGKTSLLSLFFAGVRPNLRDFLGKRAEEKIRTIDDYIRPRDHGVVACEWELDAERGLFDGTAPLYLSGVFYERSSSHEQNGQGGVERLFFGCMVSPEPSELTLEGLPLITDSPTGKNRRNLNGFRRRWRQLNTDHPSLEVFYTDKQNRFEEELTSRGIDPEVFRYQVLMNEREGGVLEKFSFTQDEDFIDFLLEVAFSPQRAKEVREQLTVFRQELVERNERLKPELEFCRGLLIQLQKMSGIGRERATVFSIFNDCQLTLRGLSQWVTERLETLEKLQDSLQGKLREAKLAADESIAAADHADRQAAFYRRHLAQGRFRSVDSEYSSAQKARTEAERRKNIWNAARPLARAWEARRVANQYRELLAQKLQEHAPQLAALSASASRFAGALNFEINKLTTSEAAMRTEAERLAGNAKAAHQQAASLGEKGARSESDVVRFEELIKSAENEFSHLRANGSVLEEESSTEQAAIRLTRELEFLEGEERNLKALIDAKHDSKSKLLINRSTVEQSVRERDAELARLNSAWEAARKRRFELESNASLLRLLQTDEVDLPSAAARAVDLASEELRRITDTILRIRVEAAEDLRALHWLEGDAELLPPSKDVESLLSWFRERKVTCWSGWEYIDGNILPEEKRDTIYQLPYLATGIVIASPHYERAIELIGSQGKFDGMHLMAPVVVLPAEAITDRHKLTWTVVGPTSDGHFDKEAAALDLNRIRHSDTQRRTEIENHESWRGELSALQHSLKSFQTEYPAGWFGTQRQALEVCGAQLNDSQDNCESLRRQIAATETQIGQAIQAQVQLSNRKAESIVHRDRVATYNRQFGAQVSQWQQLLESARRDARQFRMQQAKQTELAERLSQEGKSKERTANEVGSQSSQLRVERSKLKYVGGEQTDSAAGTLDTLRSDYELLLDDYEQKVNADSLSQLAELKDREAVAAQRDFCEVHAQYSDIAIEDVERELINLEPESTAERRFQQADKEEREAFQKLGTVAHRRTAAEKELFDSKNECDAFDAVGPLPEARIYATEALNEQALAKYRHDAIEHRQLSDEFRLEADRFNNQLVQISHEREILSKDRSTLSSLEESNQDQFDRLAEYLLASATDSSSIAVAPRVNGTADLARQISALQSHLLSARSDQQQLDARREQISQEIGDWSRQERFSRFPESICHRFVSRRASELEAKGNFFVTQLDDTIFQIEQKLQEADKHHDRVVNILFAAVDEALSLLKQISSMSRLPDSLPQAGKQFVLIETKAAESPTDRRARVADLIDELLETGDIGKDDVSLIQKAVRRVAGRMKVRVLHPDLHHLTNRVSVADLRGLSGGERLTAAILLFCALVRLRSTELNRKGSSVLVLDNPIGTASRQSFLDLQREVAHSMSVQLIYATGIKDLSAVGALENVIRLRNSRCDRRTGRRLVEAEDNDGIEAAHITFDSPASSLTRRVERPRAQLNSSVEAPDEAGRD